MRPLPSSNLAAAPSLAGQANKHLLYLTGPVFTVFNGKFTPNFLKNLMPNIDFYIVNEAPITACYRFACRLVDKAYQQKTSALYPLQFCRWSKDFRWSVMDLSRWWLYSPWYFGEKYAAHSACPTGLRYNTTAPAGYFAQPNTYRPEFFAQFNRIL